MGKRLKPVLTEGQWERIITTDNVPDLEPDEALAFMTYSLGWFTWADALEHRRVGTMMTSGIEHLASALAEQSSIKTDPGKYFTLQGQYKNLKAHQAWHYDMAVRIGALLPPMALLERLKQENEDGEEKDGGERVEEADRDREGPALGVSGSSDQARQGPEGNGRGEGGAVGGIG